MSSRSRLKKHQDSTSSRSKYLRYLPMLLIAILCFLWAIFTLTVKYPQEVADFILPQAYLPLIVPVYFALTFLFGYLTLNIRVGSAVGAGISLLLLFKLQQIAFEGWWIVLYLLIWITALFTSRSASTKKTQVPLATTE